MMGVDATGEDDVALILEALRAEVRALRVARGEGGAGTAMGAIERDLQRCAEQLEITRVVSAHWPLVGKNLPERALFLVHKVVRRALQWYIPPIVAQQNAFNDAATGAIRQLIEAQLELHDQLAELLGPAGPLAPVPPLGGEGGPAPDEAAPAAGGPVPRVRGAGEAGSDGPAPAIGDLQRLVEQAGREEPPAPLPDLGLRSLQARVAARGTVSAHRDLGGTTPLTSARALSQKVIRQYLRWMVNPIVEQQNAANAAIAGSMAHLAAADAELRARVAALRARR